MNLMRRHKEILDRWSAFHPLNRLQEEINRLFDRHFPDGPRSQLPEGWEPTVDLCEDKDSITVNAELPGLRREDIEVSVHGDTLSISGERKHEREQKQGESYRSERYFGRFHRSIDLPQPVDANNVTASYRDGVLSVRLAKTERSKRQQVEIKEG